MHQLPSAAWSAELAVLTPISNLTFFRHPFHCFLLSSASSAEICMIRVSFSKILQLEWHDVALVLTDIQRAWNSAKWADDKNAQHAWKYHLRELVFLTLHIFLKF